jgi:hypothetical protein
MTMMISFKSFGMLLSSTLMLTVSSAEKTNNALFGAVLEKECDALTGGRGSWDCTVGERTLMILTDESHNRMRIMTSIAQADDLSQETLRTLLEANFDRALDSKYALTHDGQLMSLFMHPLAELDLDQVPAMLQQVKTLADNYGTTYASSGLSFGGRTAPKAAAEKKQPIVEKQEAPIPVEQKNVVQTVHLAYNDAKPAVKQPIVEKQEAPIHVEQKNGETFHLAMNDAKPAVQRIRKRTFEREEMEEPGN